MSRKQMDPERLAALRELAASSVSEERGRWRINTNPGRVDVSSFVDGRHDETIVNDAGSRVRASMLAFDGHDLAEVLDDRDHWEAETGRALSAWHRANAEAARLSEELEAANADAKRWRARCPVTDEDVERVGVTGNRMWSWVDAMEGSQKWLVRDAMAKSMMIYESVNRSAKILGRPAHDVLDEMAAEVSL